MIFFNFRPDRAREITRTLVDPEFDGFTRQFFPVTFVCNTEYDLSLIHIYLRRRQDPSGGHVPGPPLGAGVEGAHGVDLIVKKLAPHRLVHQGREHVQNAAPQGELAHALHPVSYTHLEWNSENTIAQRKSKVGSSYSYLSLDAGVPETDLESLHESVPSAFNLERLATDHLLIDELKTALRKWKPWAEELLELYLSGAKRSCTNSLCEKYRLSDRAIQKRKTAFEKFVLDFLKK